MQFCIYNVTFNEKKTRYLSAIIKLFGKITFTKQLAHFDV